MSIIQEDAMVIKELTVGGSGDSKKLIINSTAATAGNYALEINGPTTGGRVAYINSGSSDYYQKLNNDTTTASHWFYRNLPSGTTGGPVVFIENDNAGDDQPTLFIQQDGAAQCFTVDMNGNNIGFLIDHDDTGTDASMQIDRDGNNAADIYAVKLICDNAGAGIGGGIDLSQFTAAEPLLNLPVDTGGIGAAYGRIAVNVTGVGIKYILLSEAA